MNQVQWTPDVSNYTDIDHNLHSAGIHNSMKTHNSVDIHKSIDTH